MSQQQGFRNIVFFYTVDSILKKKLKLGFYKNQVLFWLQDFTSTWCKKVTWSKIRLCLFRIRLGKKMVSPTVKTLFETCTIHCVFFYIHLKCLLFQIGSFKFFQKFRFLFYKCTSQISRLDVTWSKESFLTGSIKSRSIWNNKKLPPKQALLKINLPTYKK